MHHQKVKRELKFEKTLHCQTRPASSCTLGRVLQAFDLCWLPKHSPGRVVVRRSELCGSGSYFSKILITPHLPTLSPRVFLPLFIHKHHFSSFFSPQTQTLSNFFTPLKIKLIFAFIFAFFNINSTGLILFSCIIVLNFVNLGFEIVK